MKYISWLLTIPVAIVAVVFSVANRERVAINLWPFGAEFAVPLFILVLGSGLVGLVLGGFITWMSAGRVRRRARKAEHRASDAEREVHDLHRKLEGGPGSLREGTSREGPPRQGTLRHPPVPAAPANDAAAGPPRASTLPAGRG